MGRVDWTHDQLSCLGVRRCERLLVHTGDLLHQPLRERLFDACAQGRNARLRVQDGRRVARDLDLDAPVGSGKPAPRSNTGEAA